MIPETNYKKLAFQDTIALISGQITQAEFIRRYNINAPRSTEYTNAIINVLQDTIIAYDAKFAGSIAMTESDLMPLRRAEKEHVAEKIVAALFQIAYTRTPNNKRTIDNQPETYARKYNMGPAAVKALTTLGAIDPYVPAMNFVYNEYFFPYIMSENRKTGLLSNESILSEIRRDARLCNKANAKMSIQGMDR